MPVAFHATFTENGSFNATFTEKNGLNANFGETTILGAAFPSDDLPLMDGEASPGVSKLFSRGDHRHPHDDAKMNYMSAITNLELEEMLK